MQWVVGWCATCGDMPRVNPHKVLFSWKEDARRSAVISTCRTLSAGLLRVGPHRQPTAQRVQPSSSGDSSLCAFIRTSAMSASSRTRSGEAHSACVDWPRRGVGPQRTFVSVTQRFTGRAAACRGSLPAWCRCSLGPGLPPWVDTPIEIRVALLCGALQVQIWVDSPQALILVKAGHAGHGDRLLASRDTRVSPRARDGDTHPAGLLPHHALQPRSHRDPTMVCEHPQQAIGFLRTTQAGGVWLFHAAILPYVFGTLSA